MFVFTYSEVFSEAEMKEKLDDLPTLKKLVANSINKRLRIKEIPNYLPVGRESESAAPAESNDRRVKLNYFAFFLEDQ